MADLKHFEQLVNLSVKEVNDLAKILKDDTVAGWQRR
jgi:hypothetical protein